MKKFKNGNELAKEIGISVEELKKTFDDYNDIANGKKKDPFGKKYFFNKGGEWKLDDEFHVAQMTPVLHFTMGGVEINKHAEILGEKGIIPGLFACGELAGGVHGANRLGGSSLLGCVVFGRVAGDSAARYLLSENLNDQAAQRLGLVGGHVSGHPIETKIKVDPSHSKVLLEYSWGNVEKNLDGGAVQQSSQPSNEAKVEQQQQQPKEEVESTKQPPQQATLSEYTIDDVKKHNKKDDCWVVLHGEVLNVTEFLPEHPGGEKAILCELIWFKEKIHIY